MNRTVELQTAKTSCALRFDGYQYEASSGIDLGELVDAVIRSGTLPKSDIHCFAAFFGLQRFLHKGGGTLLPPDSQEHQTFDRLFARLALLEPSPEFLNSEQNEDWERYKSELAK